MSAVRALRNPILRFNPRVSRGCVATSISTTRRWTLRLSSPSAQRATSAYFVLWTAVHVVRRSEWIVSWRFASTSSPILRNSCANPEPRATTASLRTTPSLRAAVQTHREWLPAAAWTLWVRSYEQNSAQGSAAGLIQHPRVEHAWITMSPQSQMNSGMGHSLESPHGRVQPPRSVPTSVTSMDASPDPSLEQATARSART